MVVLDAWSDEAILTFPNSQHPSCFVSGRLAAKGEKTFKVVSLLRLRCALHHRLERHWDLLEPIHSDRDVALLINTGSRSASASYWMRLCRRAPRGVSIAFGSCPRGLPVKRRSDSSLPSDRPTQIRSVS